MNPFKIFQALGSALRRAFEYLPDFPRFPTPRRIAQFFRETTLPSTPSAPSRTEVTDWWREKRETGFLPPLPRVPGPRSIAAWLRNRKQEHVAGILPSVPTPRTVAATFQEHPGARKALLWIALLLVAATATYFAGPRAWRKVNSLRARQLAGEAMAKMNHGDWSGASQEISKALQLNPMQFDARRAYAKLLTRSGRAGNALEVWSKLSRSVALSLEDRRDYLAAAISANEIGLAEQQLQIIQATQPTPAPTDFLLAGQLAVLRGSNGEALEDAATILKDARASRRDKLAANLLVLAASTRDSTSYVTACSNLVAVARGPQDQVSLDALVILAKQLAAQPPGRPSTELLSIPLPALSSQNIPAVEVADRLEQHPASKPYHKMLALEMRARAAPENENELIRKALDSYGREDDQTAAALGAWLFARKHFEEILTMLPIDRASRSRELLIERIDALAALQRFEELKKMLLTEYPVMPQAFQHMYLAVVYEDLGKTTPAIDEWQRALEATANVDQLLALADFAQSHRNLQMVNEALARAIIKQPGLRAAYVRRLRVLEIIGPAERAHELALEVLGLWPEDLETRMHEIYLRLLVTRPECDPVKAQAEAEQLATKTSMTGVARSTIALARLKSGHPSAALEIIGGTDVNRMPANISRPVYAAILAANGWKDKARQQALSLATVDLLPEERALIAPLLGSR